MFSVCTKLCIHSFMPTHHLPATPALLTTPSQATFLCVHIHLHTIFGPRGKFPRAENPAHDTFWRARTLKFL